MKIPAFNHRDYALKSIGKARKFGIFQGLKYRVKVDKNCKKWYNNPIKNTRETGMTEHEELLMLRALAAKQAQELEASKKIIAEQDDRIRKQNIQIENMIQAVFCKHFLEKNAKYFWRMLHLQIGESCKASAGSYPASHKPLQTIFSCHRVRYGNGSSESSSSCACSRK